MDNILFTLKAIIPLLVLIALGYCIKKTILTSKTMILGLSRLCSNLLLPCSLFYSSAKSDFKEIGNLSLVVFCVVGTVVLIGALWGIAPMLIKNRYQAGSVIQGGFRSNIILFGTTLMNNMFGIEGVALMSVLCAIIVPIYNVFAVLVLSASVKEKTNRREMVKKIIHDVVTSPLIIGAVCGILFSSLEISLPVVAEDVISDLVVSGGCLAMIVLGAQFEFTSAIKKWKISIIAVLFKIVLSPLIFTVIAVLGGFRGAALASILIVFGAPTSSTSAVVAESLGCDGQLSGEIVLISTLLSGTTLFSGILLLKSLGYI